MYPQTIHALLVFDSHGRLMRMLTAPAVEQLRQAETNAIRDGHSVQVVRYQAVATCSEAAAA